MLVENLRATVRAALEAVEASCGWHLRIEQISQIPEREFPFEMVAAAHFAEGPIRRIVVGCDRELALHARKRNLDANGDEGTRAEAEPGFALICEALGGALARGLGRDEMQPILPQDPEQYRAHAGRTRNFYAYLPTPAGDLHLVLDLSRRREEDQRDFGGVDNYRGQPVGQVIQQPGETVESPEEIARILAETRAEERTLMVRLAEEGAECRLHHATALDVTPESKRGALTLTSACLLGSDFTFARGRELIVVLLHEERVLQFRSRVAGASHVAVDEGMHLPVLTVEAPACLEPGQRREAFRVVPPQRLLGRIRSRPAEGRGKGKRQHQSIVVLDLSSTGARVAIAENTLLSCFRWGCEVVCELKLPEAYGVAEVKGVVQRMLLYPDRKRKRKAHLGIEFARADEDSERGLDKIRRYVAELQREALHGRTEFVTSPH